MKSRQREKSDRIMRRQEVQAHHMSVMPIPQISELTTTSVKCELTIA